MEKKKNKVKGFIKTLVFLGLVGALGLTLYNKYIEIDGLPDSEEININEEIYKTAINESINCDQYRLYGDINSEYVKLYVAYNCDISKSECKNYITKLTWHINFDSKDIDNYQKENIFLKNSLNSRFSNNVESYGEEDYWIAAFYDFNLENPNVTYDINFKSTDLNMNDKGFQEIIRYFDLEFAYDKKVNGFSDEAWDKYIYHYNPPFKKLLNNYNFIDYEQQGCPW